MRTLAVVGALLVVAAPCWAQDDSPSVTGAGAAAVPALGGSLLKSSLPLAAGMAALDLISGKSMKQVALDFGAYLTAGIVVSAVADSIVYPFLFAAGPPGWLAAGIYTVVKVALAYYLGTMIRDFLAGLFGWDKNDKAAGKGMTNRKGVKQRLDDIERKSTDKFGSPGGPPSSNAPNPGLTNGGGSTGSSPKPGTTTKPPVGIDGPLGAPYGSDDLDEMTGAELDDLLETGAEMEPPGPGPDAEETPGGVGVIDTSMDPEAIIGELIDAMGALKDAGVTDLALDLPAWLQPALDNFCKTGDINKLIADLMLNKNDPILKLIAEAVKNGIKLIAGGKTKDGKSTGVEQAMAKDPKAKIIALKGPTSSTAAGANGNKPAPNGTKPEPTGGSDGTGRTARDSRSGDLTTGGGSTTNPPPKPESPFAENGSTDREGKKSRIGGGVKSGSNGKDGESPVQRAIRTVGGRKEGEPTTTGSGGGGDSTKGQPKDDETVVATEPGTPSSKLAWKLAAGDVLEYEHNVEQKLQVVGGDAASIQGRTLIATERLEVLGVQADGNYKVRWEVTRVRALADGKPVYDSSEPQKGGAIAGVLQKAIGRSQEFVMTPSGRLDGKRGMTYLVDDGSLGELLRAALVLPLPEQDLSETRTWQVEVQEAPVIFHNARYKFDGRISAGQAIRGDVALRLEKAPPSMKLHEGAGRQRAVFDHVQGMLRESELNLNFTFENAIEGRTLKVVNTMRATTKLKERRKK